MELVVTERLGKISKGEGKDKIREERAILEKKDREQYKEVETRPEQDDRKCDTAEQSLMKKRGNAWIGVMDWSDKGTIHHVMNVLKQRITNAG